MKRKVMVVFGTRPEAISEAAQRRLDDPTAYRRMVAAANPYGDGHAAGRIVEYLERALGDGSSDPPGE